MRSLAALAVAALVVLSLILFLFWATGLLRAAGIGFVDGFALAAIVLFASGFASLLAAHLLFAGQGGRADRGERAPRASGQRMSDAGPR